MISNGNSMHVEFTTSKVVNTFSHFTQNLSTNKFAGKSSNYSCQKESLVALGGVIVVLPVTTYQTKNLRFPTHKLLPEFYVKNHYRIQLKVAHFSSALWEIGYPVKQANITCLPCIIVGSPSCAMHDTLPCAFIYRCTMAGLELFCSEIVSMPN